MSWVGAAIVTSSVIGSNAASKAADRQAGAIDRSTDVLNQQWQTTQAQQAPFRSTGYNALNQLNRLGSGTYQMFDANGNVTGQGVGNEFFTKPYTAEDFAKGIDPGYQFRLQQGQEATNRMANMGGGMISGNALKGQEDYTQGVASQEFGNAFNREQLGTTNIFNRLSALAGLGQTSVGQTTTAGSNYAGNVAGNIQASGAAQAGGIVGQANALSGGLQQFGNQQYLSNLLASKGTQVSGIPTSSGGGASGAGGGYVAPPPPNDPYSGFRVNTA
jgi:hypothetical protein